MNKKGFTLVEIIVAIGLLALIGVGSFVGVKLSNEAKEKNNIKKTFKQADEALEIYLQTHNDVIENVNNNAEGAVITLELLKNEGLIPDNLVDYRDNTSLDYKNNFYVLTNAVLLDNPNSNTGQAQCEGQISLSVIRNWNFTNANTDDVIYICPNSENNFDLQSQLEDYKSRIENLERVISLMNIGENNYVLFDVTSDSSKIAYWPAENEDLFRIISTDDNNFRIMYNQNVLSNNNNDFNKDLKDNDLIGKNNCGYIGIYEDDSYTKDFKYLPDALYDGVYYNGSSYYKVDIYFSSWRHKIIYYNGEYYYYKTSYNNYVNVNDCPSGGTRADRIDVYKKFSTNYSEGVFFRETDGSCYRYNSDTNFTPNEIMTEYNLNSNDNSKISALASKINPDLIGHIEEKYYPYKYEAPYTDWEPELVVKEIGNLTDAQIKGLYVHSLFGFLDSETAKDLIKKNGTWLASKTFFTGSYSGSTAGKYDQITGTEYMNNGKRAREKGTNYTQHCTTMFTYPYIPLFTLDSSTSELLLDYGDYPSSYRRKYKQCETSKLGTIDCPYLIKFTENNRSVYSSGAIINNS